MKLLVDHRDELVAERRRCQHGCAGTCTSSTRHSQVPLGALDRAVWIDRLGRQLARREQSTQVRIARDLLGRCRTLTRTVSELERELHDARTQRSRPAARAGRLRTLSAAKLLCEIGPIDRFRTDAQLARHAGVAPLDASSGKHQRHRLDRGGNRQLNCALHRIAITQAASTPRARLPRTQTERRQNPTRSDPLPQTTTRTDRPHHPQKRVSIDIGATLAVSSVERPRRYAAYGVVVLTSGSIR